MVERRLGAFKLLIIGQPETQKTLFMQLISELFEVYFGDPELHNLSGADPSDDLWVLDGVSSDMYGEAWSKSKEAVMLSQLLYGQKMPIYWGADNMYWKATNIPIVLIGENEIPLGLFHPRFQAKLVVSRWFGHCPVGLLSLKRVASTLLNEGLKWHLYFRRHRFLLYNDRRRIENVPTYWFLKPLWARGGRKGHSYPVMFNIPEGHFYVDPMVDRDWRVHPGPLGFSHARRTPDGFDWKD